MLDPKLFQLMAEQIADHAVFLLATDGRIMSWSAGAQRIKGYSADEIIGRHFSVFYPPEAQASGWPAHELAFATREGRFEDEGFRVRKDGSRFWANVVITALRDESGKLVAFSKVTRDLTDRRLHEEALRQSEERFRLLIEGVVDYAIYMLDPGGIVTSWNVGAERIKGYKRDEIVGKHFSNFFSEEDVAEGKPWTELAEARDTGHAEDEGWRVKKNGERFWARVVVTALYDDGGHLRGFAKVTQDLSERRHLQDLQAATLRINEFIATLAHEIRNPLAPITTAIDLIGRIAPQDPKQDELRATIRRQAQRLGRIADEMLDIARTTRGGLVLERQPLEIAELVQQSVEVALPLIEEAQQKLSVSLPPGAVRINGDMERLTQALSNVLGNAARYTPVGGKIDLRLSLEQSELVIRVSDSGRGMSEVELGSIFQMFVQGKPPLHRVGSGLGVGLALARNIVELHGGRIDAESAGEGLGAEFTIRLPIWRGVAARPADKADNADKADKADKATAPAAPAKQRVLVVDDNIDAADTLFLLMSELGHDVHVVYSGEDAIKAFDEFRPQIVLLDIGLPGINGYEVARLLRSRSDGKRVRIIAVTGWGQPEDQRRSGEAGFDLHLVKPVDEQKLLAALDVPANGNHHMVH